MTKILFISLYSLKICGMEARMEIETNGTALMVTVTPMTLGSYFTSALDCTVSYNGTSLRMSENPFRDGVSVQFTYSDEVKAVTVSASSVSYNGVSGTSVSLAWKGGLSSPSPVMESGLILPGLRVDTDVNIRWNTADVPEGYVLCPVYCGRDRKYEDEETRHCYVVFAEKREDTGCITTACSAVAGTKEGYRVCFALYPEEGEQSASLEDYIGIIELCTPEFTVTKRSTPYAPYGLTVSGEGERKRIAWSAVEDETYPVVGYRLERRDDGGSFECVYEGESNSFRDIFPSGVQSAVWRVRSAAKYRRSSVWVTGNAVSAPSGVNVYVGIGGVPVKASAVYIGDMTGAKVIVGQITD